MNVVEATGLGKRYGSTWALRECSLAIPAGHVAALVGPNGAGKTAGPPPRRLMRQLAQERGAYSVQARCIASGRPHQPSGVRRSSSSIAPSTLHMAVTCRKRPSTLSSSKSSKSPESKSSSS